MDVDVERLYFECVIDLSRLSYTSYKITWQWGGNLSLSLENSVDNMDQLWLREDHFKTLGTIVSGLVVCSAHFILVRVHISVPVIYSI